MNSTLTPMEKFLSKCKPRSGRTKTDRSTEHVRCRTSANIGLAVQAGSAANRPKAEIQPTLFDTPPALSAEEISYQKLLNELSERERNEVLRLTGGEWMQLDFGGGN